MRKLSLAPLLVALLLPLALVLGIVGIGPLAMSDAGPVDRGGAAALVWSERVFTSKSEFAAFLRSRGASYEEWAARHPGMAPWDPRPRPAPKPRPAATKATKTVTRAAAPRVPATAARAPDAERRAGPDGATASRLTDLVDWAGRVLLALLVAGAAILGVRRLRGLGGLRLPVHAPSLTLAVSLPKMRLPAVPPIRPRAVVARDTAAVVAAATARAVARSSVVAAGATARAARRLREEIDERELPMREIGFSVIGCLAVAAIGTMITLLLSGSY